LGLNPLIDLELPSCLISSLMARTDDAYMIDDLRYSIVMGRTDASGDREIYVSTSSKVVVVVRSRKVTVKHEGVCLNLAA